LSYIHSHLTPRWIPLKTQQYLQKITYKPVLEPFKNQGYKLKNTISATFYFKKHYQEINEYTLHRKEFKERKHLVI